MDGWGYPRTSRTGYAPHPPPLFFLCRGEGGWSPTQKKTDELRADGSGTSLDRLPGFLRNLNPVVEDKKMHEHGLEKLKKPA